MRRSGFALTLLLALGAPGCREETSHDHAGAPHDESWSVTAWGERYEIFAETGALVAGRPATSNVHVTVLQGFRALDNGRVSILLRGSEAERAFAQDQPKREGIFAVEVVPEREGTFDLVFRIEAAAGTEDIAAGTVRVGSADVPGGLADGDAELTGAIPFLKEQQWRTEFATAPVAAGALRGSVRGPARVTPAAGGEVVLTAPVNATVLSEPWPYPGLEVDGGSAVLRLRPRAGERGLLDLRADAAALSAEVDAARRRQERLAELLRAEATSAAELERARATLAGLEARLRAAEQGIAAATGSPGSSSEGALDVKSPWSGRVAEVAVSPGQTVSSGAVLARLVKVRPLWVVVSLSTEDAARAVGAPSGLLLRRTEAAEPLSVEGDALRIVARSPELDPRTSSLGLIVEVDRSMPELPIGSAAEAELLLGEQREGIVVPAAALVDDGGIAVVYVQASGESFVRKEVRVLLRQGGRVMVEGLETGDRLVTRGGAAIRRSSLLSSGAPEGHVH